MLFLIALPSALASEFDFTAMSYVLPAAQCDLEMTLLHKGMLNAVTYLGMELIMIAFTKLITRICIRTRCASQISLLLLIFNFKLKLNCILSKVDNKLLLNYADWKYRFFYRRDNFQLTNKLNLERTVNITSSGY